ncbi:MAG: hypothetical protein LUD02_02745 [Tannerellaceae bacterium]|nr:hypothetical protein [Tannerellaceae bacterium]
MAYSYHIFYFPFKWEVADRKNVLFSDQVTLKGLNLQDDYGWERVRYSPPDTFDLPDKKQREETIEIFAEQNYYLILFIKYCMESRMTTIR